MDYENCNCRKKLVDKLVEECTENVEEAKITEITENKCKSLCTIMLLIAIVFPIYTGIVTYFVYSHWYLKMMILVLTLILALKQQLIELTIKKK